MTAQLVHNAYGKSKVRLTRVTRRPGGHDIREFSVDIQLEGDFVPSYTAGDNRRVIATDSMKNTVYVLAKTLGVVGPRQFATALAGHFLQEYSQVSRATIAIEEELWNRIVTGGREHPHAFVGGGSEVRTATAIATRQGQSFESGLRGLLVLKTTDSGWANFVRDRFTTLPDTNDRIFATSITATWTYALGDVDDDAVARTVRQTLLDVFAAHKSLGVQQTLFAMGDAVLAACPAVDQIRLEMPNKHRIPMNLSPFGLDNPNEVFVATDEPHGLISGTIRRGG